MSLAIKWTLVSATNNETILKSCLLASPELEFNADIILKTGYKSAAAAYNSALEESTTDIVVFAHQDVYLPLGWCADFQNALLSLSESDPKWGVLGIWGVSRSRKYSGHLYCEASGAIFGNNSSDIQEVRTLDEVLLVVRKSSGLRFDKCLQGFHMYGTDICLEAHRRGLKCYTISSFCIHNANTYRFLPFDFWSAVFFIRKKWKSVLPVTTPCIDITLWCWPMIRWNIRRATECILRPPVMRRRVSDPRSLYRDLMKIGSK